VNRIPAVALCRDVLRWKPNASGFVHLDPSEVDYLQSLAREAMAKAAKRPAKKLATGRMKPTRASKKAMEKAVYAAVILRDPVCQVSRGAFGPCEGFLEIDHQWGRGKAPTSVGNCRRLCEKHHHMKTDSVPDRIAWLDDFRYWALNKGYLTEADKARKMVMLESAQHPEREKAP